MDDIMDDSVFLFFLGGYFVLIVLTCVPLLFYKHPSLLDFKTNKSANIIILGCLIYIFIDSIFIFFGFEFQRIILSQDMEHDILSQDIAHDIRLLIVGIFGGMLVAPIVEEILFRSHMYAIFEKFGFFKFGYLLPASISSFFWTIIHTDIDLYFFVTTFLFGIALFYIRKLTNSISFCILLHSAANFLTFLALYLRDA
jgi:membrane protease YdiL (CAAX protease family)